MVKTIGPKLHSPMFRKTNIITGSSHGKFWTEAIDQVSFGDIFFFYSIS